jgi:hypothetical protein
MNFIVGTQLVSRTWVLLSHYITINFSETLSYIAIVQLIFWLFGAGIAYPDDTPDLNP